MRWFKKPSTSKTRLVFSFDDSHIYLAKANVNGKLQYFDLIALEAFNQVSLLSAVKQLVTRHQLLGLPATLVLPDNHYQMLITDQLPTSEQEMVKAFRWKLKGLLDLPINETVLDVFLVPDHGVGGQHRKAFVVAAKLSLIEMFCTIFEDCLLKLEKIDISIFSIRNLVASTPNYFGTQILVSIHDLKSVLTIFSDCQVYLVRNLNLGEVRLDQTVDNFFSEQLLLEIQRSMDYCVSELKINEPSEFLLGPAFIKQTGLLEYLANNLLKPVTCIDLNKLVTSEVNIPDDKQEALCNCIGGVLNFNLLSGKTHAAS